MAAYTRVYNLTIKDSLPTGNSGKVIKGAELDTELNAVAAAISSKADTNSPTFTGVPLAPTASYGTSTTQLATTAFVQAALQALYPVGSVYINASSTTNPTTLLGFGTWTAFGEGKVLVGQNTSDTDFDTLEETGGSKASVAAHTHTFTTGTESVGHTHSGTTSAVSNDHTHNFSGATGNESAAHTHAISISDPGHIHSPLFLNQGSAGAGNGAAWNQLPIQNAPHNNGTGGYAASNTTGITATAGTQSANHTHSFSGTTSGISANHTHTITTGDRSAAHTHSGTTASTGNSNGNLQPYVVVKMWKRTA